MASSLFVKWINHQTDNPVPSTIGRRYIKLLVVNRFWLLDKEQKKQFLVQSANDDTQIHTFTNELLNRPDPFDQEDPSGNIVNRRGVIVRTDFTNDNAWNDFCELVRRSEKDGLQDEPSSSVALAEGEDSESNSDEEDSMLLALMFHEPPPEHRTAFNNASNLSLLRLFLDVDITPISPPLEEGQDFGHSNPLLNCDGFQEIYTGRLLWVYDCLSNQDGSVRLVSSKGLLRSNIATGDSWRVKARSIWDLQLNLDSGTIAELEFQHDPSERARNFAEWGLLPHNAKVVR